MGEGSARLAALEAGKGTGVNLQVCLSVVPKEVKDRNIMSKFWNLYELINWRYFQVKNLNIPSVALSGQAVELDLDMSVTVIGDIGLLQATGSDVNVNMTFWLLESTDDLENSRVSNNSEIYYCYFW